MHFQLALIIAGATVAVCAVVVPILIEEVKQVREQLQLERERERREREGQVAIAVASARERPEEHTQGVRRRKTVGYKVYTKRSLEGDVLFDQTQFIVGSGGESDLDITPRRFSVPHTAPPAVPELLHPASATEGDGPAVRSRSSSVASGSTVPLFSPPLSTETLVDSSPGLSGSEWDFVDDEKAGLGWSSEKTTRAASVAGSDSGWENI